MGSGKRMGSRLGSAGNTPFITGSAGRWSWEERVVDGRGKRGVVRVGGGWQRGGDIGREEGKERRVEGQARGEKGEVGRGKRDEGHRGACRRRAPWHGLLSFCCAGFDDWDFEGEGTSTNPEDRDYMSAEWW